MRPPQDPPSCHTVRTVLWLTCLVLAGCSPLRANAGPHRVAFTRTVNATSAPAQAARPGMHLAAAGDKKQVPKPTDPPRYKPGKQSSSDQDDDSGSGCLDVMNCVSGLFDLIDLTSTPKHSGAASHHPLAPSPGSSASMTDSTFAVLPDVQPWMVEDRGWLVVAVPGDSVMLLESPAQRGHANEDAGHLAAGTRMVVVETNTSTAGIQLRVRPVDALLPLGWIPESALSVTLPSSPSAASPSPAAAAGLLSTLTPAPVPPLASTLTGAPGPMPYPPAGPARWGLQLVAGAGTWVNFDLHDEFSQPGFRGVLGYQNYLHPSFFLGASAGVRGFTGNARMDYLTPTTTDVPGASEFELYDIALLAGQRHGRRPGFGFSWSAGPALFYVHERSDVLTFAVATDTTGAVLLGRHDETLGRWTGGAVASVAVDWTVAPQAEVGLRLDAFVAGWDGREEKSLTSDFMHESLRGFDVGIYVNFPFR